ncbi:MAG: hypothetical protein ACFCUT_02495 [Kiloniellaceae bacterium]
MRTTIMTTAGSRPEAAATTRTPTKTILALRSARILSWKTVLVQSLGRELHALHLQQQERAFMATTHGLNYVSWRNETPAIH